MHKHHQGASAGAWFGEDQSRATAGVEPRQGNSRSSFEADRKIDARSQTGTAPDGNTDMREPANKSLLTDVSRLRSYRCTITASIPLRSSWRGWAVARPRLDTGHKRMRSQRFTRCSAPPLTRRVAHRLLLMIRL